LSIDEKLCDFNEDEIDEEIFKEEPNLDLARIAIQSKTVGGIVKIQTVESGLTPKEFETKPSKFKQEHGLQPLMNSAPLEKKITYMVFKG